MSKIFFSKNEETSKKNIEGKKLVAWRIFKDIYGTKQARSKSWDERKREKIEVNDERDFPLNVAKKNQFIFPVTNNRDDISLLLRTTTSS